MYFFKKYFVFFLYLFYFSTCSNDKSKEKECNPRCGIINGINYGKCLYNQCCSPKGYYGITSAYCSPSEGCQSEFGQCIEMRCGEEIRFCPDGQCCSKKGYCSTTSGYCSPSEGYVKPNMVNVPIIDVDYHGVVVLKINVVVKKVIVVPHVTIVFTVVVKKITENVAMPERVMKVLSFKVKKKKKIKIKIKIKLFLFLY